MTLETVPLTESEQAFLTRACGEAFLEGLARSVIGARHIEADKLTREGLDRGVDPTVLLNQGLIAGMSIVGERFARDEIFVPEVLVCARAMKAGLKVVKPVLTETGAKPIGTAVTGTVKGDLHDIGKNIVGMMWEGAGLKVVELGTNVPAEKFVAAVVEHKADVLGMSALLTTTMLYMRTVIEAIDKAGLRGQVRILVGGAPLTQKFADSIGADGWAPNAAGAVSKMREVLRLTG